MGTNIIILGGGYGGVLTAKQIEKKVRKQKREKDITITLIDKNPFHTMLTELHEVAANRVEEESIKMDLKKIFAGRNVNVVLDEITKIDFNSKKLDGKNKSYSYDYLVLGTGSKPTYFGIAGAAENSFPLWSYDDAIKLKEHFISTFRAAERETNLEKRKKMLTFFVVGSGFTGVEMAGEIAEWTPRLCEDYHIPREDVTIYMVDALDRILTSIPEKLSAKAAKRLKKMKVNIKLGAKVVKVDKDAIELSVNNKTERHSTNTVIWAAGIEGSDVLKSSEVQTVARGRVETDEYLKSKDKNNVYVVGDNIFFTPKGEKMAVPQMVENAEASSHVVANNIVADITKTGEKHKYAPKFHGMMVCIGGKYGVAYVGTHTKKFGLPSFFAMLSKHFINIIYFIQVLGWNKIFSYISHEFFRVKDNRSFVGGYFANFSPNFWLFPLRLFLGYSWVKESIDKIPKILDDPTNIFLFTIPGQVDTTTAASAAESAAVYGEALPVPGFISAIVDWSMGTLIAPVAPFFQGMMVFAELVVGLLLLAGLFTACTSIISAALCVMIYVSGMAGESIIWYFVAGIALIGIGGTGHVFSLDYYVLPWLKKRWRNIKFVKRWYLYND